MDLKFAEEVVGMILSCNTNICGLRLVSTSEKSYGLSSTVIAQSILGGRSEDPLVTIDQIKACSESLNISLTRAALNLALKHGIPLSERGANALTRHNEMCVKFVIGSLEWMQRAENILEQCGGNSMIALSSYVDTIDGEPAHIPMLDLACKNDSLGYESAVAAVRALSMPGFLLNSGKSFHFYGKKIVNTKDFVRFLGRAALLAPIVDAPWVAHQLIEGAAALRLSAKGSYSNRPFLVCEI